MTVYYTTASKVAALLQVDAFDLNSTPTITQVEEIINRKEDEIDYFTNHSWREKTVTEELHTIEFRYNWLTGRPVYLNHRKVKTFDSNSGDKLEVWDGSNWVDWLTTYTEGRGNDFWVDYEQGIIYIKSMLIKGIPIEMRVTYRYGETTVPGDIEDACTKMVAIDLLTSDDRSVLLPEGTSNIPLGNKQTIWRNDINRILTRRQEFIIVSR